MPSAYRAFAYSGTQPAVEIQVAHLEILRGLSFRFQSVLGQKKGGSFDPPLKRFAEPY